MGATAPTTIDVSLFVTILLFIINIALGWLGKLLYGANTTMSKEIHRLSNEIHSLALKQAERYVSNDQFERVVSALSKQIDSLEEKQAEGFRYVTERIDIRNGKSHV